MQTCESVTEVFFKKGTFISLLHVCSCFFGQHALLSDVHFIAFAGFSATLKTSHKTLWRGATDDAVQHTTKAVSVDIHFIKSRCLSS